MMVRAQAQRAFRVAPTFQGETKHDAPAQPGCLTKLIDPPSGANVTLEPGTYVFKDGLFKINSGSKVKGSGVLLFFTGSGTRLEVDQRAAQIELEVDDDQRT
jgi:hypothetical protein